MQYVVICKDNTVFYTDYPCFMDGWSDMIYCVIDLGNDMATFDGIKWSQVDFDHL